MKIKTIETKIISIPLDKLKYSSTRPIITREYLITKVTTDDEIVGWGITFGGRDTKLIVENELKPLLLKENPAYVESLWNKMFNKTLRWGRRGIYIRAISTIDIALWDIKCKAYQVPLYKMLGGYRRSVPAYASGGYYKIEKPEKGFDEVEAISEEMQKNVDEGFFAAKMKVGGRSISLDIDRIRAAREILGKDRKLYIDVNNGWKLYQLTSKIIDELEEIGVDWIEEPFMPDAINETLMLKEKTRIPIATGEIHSTRWDFKQLLESKAVDIWQPDATVLGGITEYNKVINMASIWDIPVAPHVMHEIHIHLAAACPESQGFILEYFDTTGDTINYGKLLKKPLKAKNGYLITPDEPGVGMDFDDELIEKYELKDY